MKNPFLTGRQVYLRPIEPNDSEIVVASNNDPLVRQTFFTHTPKSIARAQKEIDSLYSQGADYIPLLIALKEDDRPVGITAFHRLDLISGAAVYSISLSDADIRGKGIGREVTAMMLEYGFDILNLHRIQLHVWTGNDAAVRLYEKEGFIREGVLREAMNHKGTYCDFYVMGLLEQEWRSRK